MLLSFNTYKLFLKFILHMEYFILFLYQEIDKKTLFE